VTATTTPLAILRRDGWCQGVGRKSTGERCLGSAICESTIDQSEQAFDLWANRWTVITDIIREQFGDRMSGNPAKSPIIELNDHPATVFADIEVVCTKAELRLAETVR
jgi:hypothetical protein